MRGRIIKREGSNNYTIVLQLGLDPATGKRKQQWIAAGPSIREAQKQLTKLLYELYNGTYIQPDKTSVAEYLKRWLEESARQNLSPRSYERYDDIIKKRFIPEFGRIPLKDLKPEHL